MATPTLFLLLQILAQLCLLRDLSSEEATSLLLRIEVVPFGLNIVLLVKCSKVTGSVWSVILLVLVVVVVTITTCTWLLVCLVILLEA